MADAAFDGQSQCVWRFAVGGVNVLAVFFLQAAESSAGAVIGHFRFSRSVLLALDGDRLLRVSGLQTIGIRNADIGGQAHTDDAFERCGIIG